MSVQISFDQFQVAIFLVLTYWQLEEVGKYAFRKIVSAILFLFRTSQEKMAEKSTALVK